MGNMTYYINLTTYKREFNGEYTIKTYETRHVQGSYDELLFWRVGAANRRNYAGPDAYFEMPYVDTSEGLNTSSDSIEAWIKRRDERMVQLGMEPNSRSLATKTLSRLSWEEHNQGKVYDGPLFHKFKSKRPKAFTKRRPLPQSGPAR